MMKHIFDKHQLFPVFIFKESENRNDGFEI